MPVGHHRHLMHIALRQLVQHRSRVILRLDHRKLSYFYGGLEQRLTGVQEAHVIREVIA